MMAGDDRFVQAPIDLTTTEFGDLYDELPLWSAPFGLLLLDRVPLDASVIVDVGAGTGFLALELAQRSRAATVHAVDPWGAACARLRRKVAQIGLEERVHVYERDAVSIPLLDDSADLVVSNLGVNNFENAPAVLRECFRVLRPGGRILLATNLVGHMAEFYEAFRTVLPLSRWPALDAHIAHRATVPKVQAQLAAAGFVPGSVTEGSFRLRYANGAALFRHWFIRFGFLPAWIEVAGEDAEAVLRTLQSKLSGELSLTVPMACIGGVKP